MVIEVEEMVLEVVLFVLRLGRKKGGGGTSGNDKVGTIKISIP